MEGPRSFLAACQAGAPIEHVIVAPSLLTSALVRDEVGRLADSGVPCSDVSPKVFASLSARQHPTGIAAIVGIEELSLDDLPRDEVPRDEVPRDEVPRDELLRDDLPRTEGRGSPVEAGTTGPSGGLFLALVGVSDPGNLGTIMRTLDAVGGSGLVLVGDTTDPHHPTAVKASMGTLFTMPWARCPDVDALCEWAAGRSLRTVGTSAHAATEATPELLAPPLLLVLGSEREGLSAEDMAQLDLLVSLPMWGSSTSLNLAVAAGVLLYDARRGAGR